VIRNVFYQIGLFVFPKGGKGFITYVHLHPRYFITLGIAILANLARGSTPFVTARTVSRSGVGQPFILTAFLKSAHRQVSG